jgi:hypothetical protein
MGLVVLFNSWILVEYREESVSFASRRLLRTDKV